MAPSIFLSRTTNRLLSISYPAASSFYPSSYKLLRTTNNFRCISSSTTARNPKQSSFSDRGIVIGLLTLTTLIGFGFGTRSKSQPPTSHQLEQNLSSESSTSTANSTQGQGTHLKTEKNENDEKGSGNESEQAGAFNPETGEINWDCPCLGGMAHGTCGEQFKAAFSCFVYSEQEPKGVECIEKFKLMQDCFKEHPDEYGPELSDSDDPTAEEGELPPDSSEPGTSSTSAESDESQAGSEDRELRPNRSSPASNQDNDTTTPSPLIPSNEITSSPPDTPLLTSIQIDSNGKSSLL